MGITLDAMAYAKNTDVVVLASGDGDFDLLLKTLYQEFGVQTEVYGVPQLTALSLINAATRFIPIDSDLLMRRGS